MHKASIGLSIAAFAGIVGLALTRPAESQIQVAPSYLPIGAAASGSGSTAWFHHPPSGRVVACQATPGAGSAPATLQCVDAKLP